MTPSAIEDNKPALSSIYLSNNPVADFIGLNIVPGKSTPLTIKLFSVDGRLARNLFEGIISGKTEFNFGTDGLQNGIYFLNISSGKETKVLKVAVAR
jgi:hypothetical protein